MAVLGVHQPVPGEHGVVGGGGPVPLVAHLARRGPVGDAEVHHPLVLLGGRAPVAHPPGGLRGVEAHVEGVVRGPLRVRVAGERREVGAVDVRREPVGPRRAGALRLLVVAGHERAERLLGGLEAGPERLGRSRVGLPPAGPGVDHLRQTPRLHPDPVAVVESVVDAHHRLLPARGLGRERLGLERGLVDPERAVELAGIGQCIGQPGDELPALGALRWSAGSRRDRRPGARDGRRRGSGRPAPRCGGRGASSSRRRSRPPPGPASPARPRSRRG